MNKDVLVQEALYHRVTCDRTVRLGQYDAAFEINDSRSSSRRDRGAT
jgi:hypothetical protein